MKLTTVLISFSIFFVFACRTQKTTPVEVTNIPENPNQTNPPQWVMNLEAEELSNPIHGITTDGEILPGLFRIKTTGVSTKSIRIAAENFIASLDENQKSKVSFPIDDDEWRKWCNMHLYPRQGVALIEMNEEQKKMAFSLISNSLSAKGLSLSKKIMALEGEIARRLDNYAEYGEERYYFTIMGEPHKSQPWGWQVDGHHLNVNFFILGDQVVMTPAFMGSEPTRADEGPYKGTVVFEEEAAAGLKFIRSLTPEQQEEAIVLKEKKKNNNQTEAFKDNQQVPYQGIKASEFNPEQLYSFYDLIYEYIGNMNKDHAEVRMDEIRAFIEDTWFSWVGGTEDNSLFYYRIQSPVVLIEFDHQGPIALRDSPRGVPTRNHIHTVVRTPNGNDYGKDLLRQHLAEAH